MKKALKAKDLLRKKKKNKYRKTWIMANVIQVFC